MYMHSWTHLIFDSIFDVQLNSVTVEYRRPLQVESESAVLDGVASVRKTLVGEDTI